MLILKNGTIYSEDLVLENKAVVIEDKIITKIIDVNDMANYSDATVIDCCGKIICPGFLDLQVNGFGGKLLNAEISEETVRVMCESSRKFGATTLAPTLITTSDESIYKAIELFKNLKEKYQYDFTGLHIEGPYLSMEKKGVHNPKYVRKPDMNMIRFFAQNADVISIVTLAPENASKEVIETLVNAGIVVSMGHTNASFDEALVGINNGITMATHLYNAMSGFMGRLPGALGAALMTDVYAGIIVDGFHSTFSAVDMAKKLKGDRLFLVTDAASPAGTDMKEFVFEGIPAFHENGKLFTADGTLAGSAITMIDTVKNCVKYTNISLKETLKMATLYPAKSIRLDNQLGKIKEGYVANILILEENLDINTVIHKGCIEKA